MTDRKAIQILRSPPQESQAWGVLYALCDDGTIWWMNESPEGRWVEEKPIPTDDGYHGPVTSLKGAD